MKRIIVVRGVAVYENKLLCVRNINKETGGAQPFWSLPGGKLEPGEALAAGINREMLEETGIKPDISSLLFVQQFSDGEREFLEFFFSIKNPADYLSVDLAKTTHGQEEIAQIGFVDPSTAFVLPRFLSSGYLAAQDLGQAPAQIFSFL